MSPFVWQQSPKCQFFGQRTSPKITRINRQYLIQTFVKNEKSPKHSKPQKVRTWHLTGRFPLNVSPGYTPAILSEPVLRVSSCLVHTRKEFCVEPPSTTSKISKPFRFFTAPNSPKLPWKFLESIYKTARETTLLVGLDVSYRARFATQSALNHLSPLFSFRGNCLYPQPSLMMPDWGLKTGGDKLTRLEIEHSKRHVCHVTI